jgi:MinD-like ATPase involved in chromosome partitioning or flagellar assembly
MNPDWGSLRRLVGRATPRTIVDLLNDYAAVARAGLGALQAYMAMFGRLPVLLAPTNPDDMAKLTPRDYDRVVSLLSAYYGLVWCDAGTGYRDKLTQYAIQRADHLVVVSTPDEGTVVDNLESIQYLASARYAATYTGLLDDVELRARLLEDVTLVVNKAGEPGAGDAPLDPRKLRAAASACNAVLDLPYSARLKGLLADGTLTMDSLPVPYRRAVKQLLVAVLSRLADV